jgi:mRNA (guanine-N7-)-methyltransferase
MASQEPEDQPWDSNSRRQAAKRKRETPAQRLAANKASRSNTPNAFARRSPPRNAPPPQDDDGDRSPPRKRPGARATMGRNHAGQMQRQIEERQRKDNLSNQASGAELVAQHYNAVPERGREWRSTESKIKGLRSLNNWIKSTLIQKFSRPEIPVEHMTVLDMACGKGGDLGKWEKAPQTPSLYVGCDIADVSIDQARSRYNENMRRGGRNRRAPPMEAQFYVQDTFGTSLGDIPIVRQVGFDPNAGPGPQVVQGRMFSGGFDVVSMMFALHYSFESEELARGMLRNVSGALKKGGRFIGVMPNSNVITEKVKDLLAKEAPGKTPNGKSTPAKAPEGHSSRRDDDEDDWDPERPSEPQPAANGGGDDDDDWDPEKPSEPQPPANGSAEDDDDDWDPEKPSEPIAAPSEAAPLVEAVTAEATPVQDPASATPASTLPPIEFGNELYTVKLPRHQPLVSKALPRDGIFRPPYGWRYHYSLQEAVDAPEFIVPFEAFRALAEEYNLELLYRKGFREVYEDESEDRELGMLAERMGVRSRDRSAPNNGCLVGDEEMEAAAFYHAFCFYKT